MAFSIPDVNLASLLPEIVLLAAAAGVLLFDGRAGRRRAAAVAAAAVASSLATIPFLFRGAGMTGFSGLIVKDDVTLVFLALMDLAALGAIVLASGGAADAEEGGELYGLTLFALIGMHLMAASRDLLVLFLGMETLALPLYILVGSRRASRDGMEAAVKYFLLGSFASALFLLGLALYYGATGTAGLGALSQTPARPSLAFAGLALVTAGVGFKIAAVPFHMWAPDAYEGAPVPVAAYISVAPKVAAFAVLLRLGLSLPGPDPGFWTQAVLAMSAASMIVGNLAALRQRGFVRMLAYSGVAQAGYMLIGLAALPARGGEALVFYLLVYLFMNLGAFAAAAALERREGGRLQIEDLSGLASRRPLFAFALAVFMVSLAGLPPTGGFFAKFTLFKAGIDAGQLPVVLVAVVMTVVSLFYYLRVVAVLYMRDGAERPEIRPAAPLLACFIGAAAVLTLLAGVLPGEFIREILAAFAPAAL
ncbi:MAG TPA: NADH-quinone oxidoreductase subunit N [Syntrophales bacterium]|nr:NADH-quinone oxidoreductase subunit N [Syntrophales bacterium]